jgi:hypothetical protein
MSFGCRACSGEIGSRDLSVNPFDNEHVQNAMDHASNTMDQHYEAASNFNLRRSIASIETPDWLKNIGHATGLIEKKDEEPKAEEGEAEKAAPQ